MFIRMRVETNRQNKWDWVSKHANACLLLKPVFNQNTTSCAQFMLYCNRNTQVTITTASAQAHKNFVTHKYVPVNPFLQIFWIICIKHSKFSNSVAKLEHLKHQYHYKSCNHTSALQNKHTKKCKGGWGESVIILWWWQNILCDLSVGCECVKTRLPTWHA
jgi:hypothetical protein